MRNEKTYMVNHISSVLTESDYVYFMTYSGLKVQDMATLRAKLAETNAKCQVLKNSLIAKSIEIAGISVLSGFEFKESTALVFGKGDASASAKVLAEFGKTFKQVTTKGGYFDGQLLEASDVEVIASLPSKEVLRAQLLGVLQGPARNLVSLLNNKAASIINVINAYKDLITA